MNAAAYTDHVDPVPKRERKLIVYYRSDGGVDVQGFLQFSEDELTDIILAIGAVASRHAAGLRRERTVR